MPKRGSENGFILAHNGVRRSRMLSVYPAVGHWDGMTQRSTDLKSSYRQE